MAELVSSVETTARKEIFLVLSASTKYRDLMKIADTYKEIADYKLIFTKLDETSTLGNIYNLKSIQEHSCPMLHTDRMYLTTSSILIHSLL